MIEQMKKPIHHMILDAIDANDNEDLEELFRQHPDYVEFEFLDGWLHYAARTGAFEVVKYLLGRGFEVNKGEQNEGVTPLVACCEGGHYEIVKYLLDHGAKIDVSASVRNPLFAVITESVKQSMNQSWGASTGEAPQIVQLLLERGLDSTVRYNSKSMKNMDAVAFATMMGAHDLARQIALWNAKELR